MLLCCTRCDFNFGRLKSSIICAEATKIIRYTLYCPLIDALLEQQASFFIVTMRSISKIVTKPPFDYNLISHLWAQWQTSSAIRIEDYWTIVIVMLLRQTKVSHIFKFGSKNLHETLMRFRSLFKMPLS
jgi:hypothetical protein